MNPTPGFGVGDDGRGSAKALCELRQRDHNGGYRADVGRPVRAAQRAIVEVTTPLHTSGLRRPRAYPIAVIFDAADLEQAEVLRAFQASFGERHAVLEDLDPTRHVCLIVLPGGVREAR